MNVLSRKIILNDIFLKIFTNIVKYDNLSVIDYNRSNLLCCVYVDVMYVCSDYDDIRWPYAIMMTMRYKFS